MRDDLALAALELTGHAGHAGPDMLDLRGSLTPAGAVFETATEGDVWLVHRGAAWRLRRLAGEVDELVCFRHGREIGRTILDPAWRANVG